MFNSNEDNKPGTENEMKKVEETKIVLETLSHDCIEI